MGLDEKDIPEQNSPASTSRRCVFSSGFLYDITKIDVIAMKPYVTCDFDAPDVNAKEWQESMHSHSCLFPNTVDDQASELLESRLAASYDTRYFRSRSEI